MRKLYRRYTSLDRARRRLVVEAAALLVLVWIGLRALRFLTLRRLIDRSVVGTRVKTGDARTIDAVRWAIGAAGRRLPWATCLVQALAADAMLRRRGIDAELRFGVRALPDGAPPIEGHAWVECEGGATIGAADDSSPFAVLTEARSR